MKDEFREGKIHMALQHLLPKITPEQNITMLPGIPYLDQNTGKYVRTSSAGKHQVFNWELNIMEYFRGCWEVIIIFSVPGGG